MSTKARAVSKFPSPLYNTPSIPYMQKILPRDSQGLLKQIETILMPGTKLQIIEEAQQGIYKIRTLDYEPSSFFYIDSRFLLPAADDSPERKKILPSSSQVIELLKKQIGNRYFWGGNWGEGIPEMREFYPHFSHSPDEEDLLCKGVDCSGLLYQATNGYTPRNTSQLSAYGKEICLSKENIQNIQEQVKPLDIMVWHGHVLIALNANSWIESTIGQGVICSDFKERYFYFSQKLLQEKKKFFIRRWHPDFLT